MLVVSTYPSEKYEFVQLGRMTSHIYIYYGKLKHVWNHHPFFHVLLFFSLIVGTLSRNSTRGSHGWLRHSPKGSLAKLSLQGLRRKSTFQDGLLISHGGVVKSTSNDHHHHVFLIRGMLVFILGIHQRFNILLNMDQISRSGSFLDTSTCESKRGKAAPELSHSTILTLSSKNVRATEHGIWVMAIPQWYMGNLTLATMILIPVNYT